MNMHALVAMPSRSQHDSDFAAIYADYVKPALEDAGFMVLRSNQLPGHATRCGRFQKLLLADLVVVDLALDDPDVWYELGLRHALLARGVVLIRRASDSGERNGAQLLHYHLSNGRPDARHWPRERQSLTSLALANAVSWQERRQARPGSLSRLAKTAWNVPDRRAEGRDASATGAGREARPARQVFLFSGHMVDAPDRPTPRFPADKENIAAHAINARLDALGMAANDLAICGGACGGDLLFAEAALRRACTLHLYLQFDEADFLEASVAFAGQSWVDRYLHVKQNPLTRIHVQPQELGPLDDGMNAYVRNNLWQLCTALVQSADAIRFIALWNGEGGAGPGGTQNMVDTVRRYAGEVSILDTRPLFGL